MTVQGPASLPSDVNELAVVFDSAWTLLSSILLLLLQLGFALLEAGTVQERHLVGTLMQHLLMLMVGAVAWILFGSMIAFSKGRVELNMADEEQANSLFGLFLCLTTVAIALRGVAERAKFLAHVAVAVAVSAVLYPMALRWSSGDGWLQELDPPFHAGAGAAALHLVGGVAAAVGARLAGFRHEAQAPRRKRGARPRLGEHELQAHRVPAVVIGTLVVWIGWYGFGAFCTTGMRTRQQAFIAARVAVNTTLGALSGGLFAFATRAVYWRASIRRISPQGRGHKERSGKAASCPDLVACCLGAMSGLVAISGVCDCVDNSSALVVGALGSAASLVGARALKALKVDDPMETGAVHGCAGAMGIICVGLFHRHEGLFVSGGWDLLGTQLLGASAIGWFTGLASFLLFRTLRCLGVLGWQKQRQREELGMEAIQELFAILDRYDLQVEDTMDALTKLQGVICRPFSPQAGNNKIEGEVLDVCSLLSYNVKPNDEYLAFISHYKAESGDAARIIYDHITHAILNQLGVGSGDESPRLGLSSTRNSFERLMLKSETEPEGLVDRMTGHSNTLPVLPCTALPNAVAPEQAPASSRTLRQLPPEEEEPEVEGRGFSSYASSFESKDLLSDLMSQTFLNFRSLLLGAGPSEPQLDRNRLLFLDSVELRDLDELLNAVRSSSNFMILLTKGVLTRPWVLAELSVAVAAHKNIVAVRIEWPCKDDEKHFLFPDCIEAVVQQLEALKEESARDRNRRAWAGRPLGRVAESLKSHRPRSSSAAQRRTTPSTSAAHSETSTQRTPSSENSPLHRSGSPPRGQCDGFRATPTSLAAKPPFPKEPLEQSADNPVDIA